MNPSVLLLRLITLIGAGASSCLGSTALGQDMPHGQRPRLHSAASGTQGPRLLATFVNVHAQRSLAVVRVAATTTSQTLHVGDELSSGLRVHAIAHDHIVLAHGSQLSTLPLLGMGSARRQPAHAPTSNAGLSTAAKGGVATTTGGGAVLGADNLDAVRAACKDAMLMAALADAQKAELGALGLCTQR